MLSGLKALDLTDIRGYLCGKILADLGVEVIKIEPPGGDPGRNTGPFYYDEPDPEKSLYWFAYNMNKKGITLNIETRDGRKILLALVKKADFLIESFSPGYLEKLGLGYTDVRVQNQRIIMTSISPFGQTGPYKDYKAPDIVGMAMGGIVYPTGAPDRPPVRISFPQAYLHASAHACVGTMIAYYYRETTGKGQHVDQSMQQSLVYATTNLVPFWELSRRVLRRAGVFRGGVFAKTRVRQLWPCKDGFVSFMILGGKAGAGTMQGLVEWMDSEKMADSHIKGVDWNNFNMATVTQKEINGLEKKIGEFFLLHTKSELYKGALQRRILLQPLSDMDDLIKNQQLEARNFWREIRHDEVSDSIKYPGPFVQMSKTPLCMGTRAPLIGEHNENVYMNELGYARDKLVILKQAGII